MKKDMMKAKALIYGMEKKNLNELSQSEQIRLYLNDHPEALSEKLMAWVASYYMNYGYIRMRIKEIYPEMVHEYLMNNNFVRLPDHYEQEKET
jgi:hypothetical protein